METKNALVTLQHSRKIIPKCVIDNKNKIIIPVDYSFRAVTEFAELDSEEPRNPKDRQVKKDEEGRYDTSCVRLNNNCIRDLKDSVTHMERLFVNLKGITWLNLSCNEICTIDECICEFSELRILNLHGNHINNILDVEVLEGLPKLFKLTLHGNPIEQVKNYRWYVLSRIPQLKEFDFSGVTKADRLTAEIWKKNNPPMKGKKKSKVEQTS